MRSMTVIFTRVAIVSLICFNAHAQSPTSSKHYAKNSFKSDDGTRIDYWLMTPATVEDDKKYPLVLALHGRGGNTTAANVLGSKVLRERYPCFVMAPASTKKGNWAAPRGRRRRNIKAMLPTALEALDSVIKKYPVDSNRIYVTGQSMGGAGTFGALSHRPNFFAAAIPVCGGWDPKDARKMADTPIWVFHGAKDKVVPTDYSRSMVAAIKAAGGTPKYTEFKGIAHNSWDKTYGAKETWRWLFGQRRNSE